MTFIPVLTSIRDAVVAKLNGSSLTPLSSAVAVYDIVASAKALSSMTGGGQLIVCPAGLDPKLMTRGGPQNRDVEIDVGVQYKCVAGSTKSPAELDPYQNEIEQVGAVMLAQAVTIEAGEQFQCVKVAFPHGAFLQKHLDDFRVFTSVCRLTFLVDV